MMISFKFDVIGVIVKITNRQYGTGADPSEWKLVLFVRCHLLVVGSGRPLGSPGRGIR